MFDFKDMQGTRGQQKVEAIYDEVNNHFAYVINNANGGWAIISTTKSYYPILAYSYNGNFDMDFELMNNNNNGVNIWLDEVAEAIKEADSLDEASSCQIAMQWLKYDANSTSTYAAPVPGGNSPEAIACRSRLKELNETYYKKGWSFMTLTNVSDVTIPAHVYSTADNIESPYEYTIIGIRDVSKSIKVEPMISTEWTQDNYYNALCPDGCLAGCVPIAMAQLMKFYEYPCIFEWFRMMDTYATYATQSLIYHICKTVKAKFGKEATNVTPENALKGFKTYGYDAILKKHNDDDVIKQLWEEYRPLIMTGRTDDGKGHAWVCDGVDNRVGKYEYYVEYLKSDLSYENLGETTMQEPGNIKGTSHTIYHMNWGEGHNYIGWYSNVKPKEGKDYKNDRQNFYITPNFNSSL